MSRVLHYYAHPGHRHSRANRGMFAAAAQVDGITSLDLYRAYPRFDIDVPAEQARLVDHDVILFQFPVFWYAAPALVKEWQDLVLDHGFAYGRGGDRLAGKTLMLAVTAAGPQTAYGADGYQQFPLRTFLTPYERTAGLCQMDFAAPYVLFGSLRAAQDGGVAAHAAGFRTLLEALRDDRYDLAAARGMDVVTADTLPLIREGV